MCRFAKKNILLYKIILRMSFRISLDNYDACHANLHFINKITLAFTADVY